MRAMQLTNRNYAGVAVLSLLLLAPDIVEADRCSCTDQDLPRKPASSDGSVMAYEPAQRAISLWDGKEEILFLSTDLSFRSSTTLTEVLPFPSLPTARIGSLDVFSDLSNIISRKGGPAPDWLPSYTPSPVSNVQPYAWRELSANMIASLGSATRIACRSILERYRSRGYEYLVFDEVDVKESLQSFRPIEYRFRSEKVYYPLEISMVDFGQTRVDLFIISHTGVTQIGNTDYPANQLGSYVIDSTELGRLSPSWRAFMGGQSAILQHVRMVGDIRKMSRDFFAR
jgi:hypothetical protein